MYNCNTIADISVSSNYTGVVKYVRTNSFFSWLNQVWYFFFFIKSISGAGTNGVMSSSISPLFKDANSCMTWVIGCWPASISDRASNDRMIFVRWNHGGGACESAVSGAVWKSALKPAAVRSSLIISPAYCKICNCAGCRCPHKITMCGRFGRFPNTSTNYPIRSPKTRSENTFSISRTSETTAVPPVPLPYVGSNSSTPTP